MGDHFVMLVDRLLTESTLEAAIQSRNRSKDAIPSTVDDLDVNCLAHKIDFGNDLSLKKLVECRICQDEDFDSNMETPCSCCGSLKYAHRRCVQRWCNEKGNTLCEICHQQFKPGYTAPPPLFQFGGIPMNFRGNWEISRRGLGNPRLIAMVSTDRNFLVPEYDHYAASASRSLLCCRSLAILFMILLIIRHAIPIITNQFEFTFPLFLLLLLRTVGIILPIYAMVRVFDAIQRRRRQQEPPESSSSSSEDEIERPILQHRAHIIQVQN